MAVSWPDESSDPPPGIPSESDKEGTGERERCRGSRRGGEGSGGAWGNTRATLARAARLMTLDDTPVSRTVESSTGGSWPIHREIREEAKD